MFTAIYKYRIKPGAKERMGSVLQFPESGAAIVDTAKCCIVNLFPANEYYLKQSDFEQGYPNIAEIRIHEHSDVNTALILLDFLEDLPDNEWVIR